MIAAPGFEDSEFTRFKDLAKDKGITLIKERLRNHAKGIDIGFTRANLGIAPEEKRDMHVGFLDNGRKAIAKHPFREQWKRLKTSADNPKFKVAIFSGCAQDLKVLHLAEIMSIKPGVTGGWQETRSETSLQQVSVVWRTRLR